MDISYQPLLQNNNWIVLVFFIMIAVSVALKYYFEQQFKQQQKIVTQNVWTPTLKLNYSLVFNLYNIGFAIILSLCLGFVILLIRNNSSEDLLIKDFYSYSKVSGLVLMFLIFKYVANLLFLTVFKLGSFMHKTIYIKVSYLNFLSLFILIWLPFVLFSNLYRNEILYTGSIASLLLALYFYYLIIKSNHKYILKHSFYFILYLCALEIAPLIILYKVFISKV